MSELKTSPFGYSYFVHWSLFGIWDLVLGIFILNNILSTGCTG